MSMEIRVDGVGELEKFLRMAPDEFNYKFLTGIFRSALEKNFVRRAKALAPVLGDSRTTRGRTEVKSRKFASRAHHKGNLRNSITTGLSKGNRKMAAVWAGVTAGPFGYKDYDAFYAHMVEYGHNIKPRRRGVKASEMGIFRSSGKEWKRMVGGAHKEKTDEQLENSYVKARPFIRPALEQTKGAMWAYITGQMEVKFRRIVARYQKRLTSSIPSKVVRSK